jgi:hypothetical protein
MMLGFGAVDGLDDGGECWEASWGWEGGSCSVHREVEKGRFDDISLVA